MPLFGQKSTTKPPSRREYFHLDKEAAKLQEKHRYEESEALYRQALDAARQITPEDKDILQMANFNLAGVLLDQKRYAEAEPFFTDSCRYCEEGFGVDDLNGEFRNREYLTNVLVELGKYVEAETLLQKRLGSLRRQLSEDNIITVVALAGLALVTRRQQKTDAADAYTKEAIDTVQNEPNLTEAERKDVLDVLTAFLADDAASYLDREKALFLACTGLMEKEMESGKVHYQGHA